MKGRIGIALVLLAAAGCGLFLWWTRPVGELSHLLGVDLAQGTLVEETDTHGGFQGDGERQVTFSFAGHDLAPVLAQTQGWQPLPLPETLSAALYGRCEGNTQIGPYLSGSLPEVTQGYFWFQDRYPQGEGSEDPTGLLDRSSVNFTAALYDAQSQMLYYIEVDT